MILLRTAVAVALVVAAVLCLGAPSHPLSVPAASAQALWTPIGGVATPIGIPAGGCPTTSIEGQGRTGGNAIQSCVVGGLSFIGPASNVSTVVGPTIIAASFVGTPIVAGGNVAIGP
jgi:hypothetical protein